MNVLMMLLIQEEGQGMVEYIFVLSMIAMVLAYALDNFGSLLSDYYATITSSL